MEQNEEFAVSDDAKETADAATFHLLPEKSKKRYTKEMEKFCEWIKAKKEQVITETVVVAYFNELIEKYAPPSLWSTYSMLRTTLFIFEKVDISKFKTLLAVLKSNSKGYQPKKAKIFEQKDIEKFISEAPDETFLLMKMAVIMGVMGGCRCDELVNLKTADIEDKGSILIVNIPKTKNYKPRSFVITDGQCFDGLAIYRKYVALRPASLREGRFFLSYRAGKCTVQPVGINTLSKIPRLVADYLEFQDAHLYTGHCFRQTSAAFLTNNSADIPMLKRHGDWRPPVSESYVEESVDSKIDIAKSIVCGDEEASLSDRICVKVEPTENSVTDDTAGTETVESHPFSSNSSADVLAQKRHGDWHSSSVAEGCAEESMESKIDIAKIFDSDDEEASKSKKIRVEVEATENSVTEGTAGTGAHPFSASGILSGSHLVFHNCVVNIYTNK